MGRMAHNPKGVADSTGILQGFFGGSLIAAPFIFGVLSDNEGFSILAIFLMLFGVFLILASIMREGEEVFFFEIIGSAIVGMIVSLIVSMFGLFILAIYAIAILILAIAIQTRSVWKKS